MYVARRNTGKKDDKTDESEKSSEDRD
jgi:hypothetical protein